MEKEGLRVQYEAETSLGGLEARVKMKYKHNGKGRDNMKYRNSA